MIQGERLVANLKMPDIILFILIIKRIEIMKISLILIILTLHGSSTVGKTALP